ncbi:uncharacterized protein HKW66_Vig0005430 [Vigna angularis]|uniref:Uncharacterized protein n=1 Tax=Phaseolus angularis TaxID=3914 RepID=A0A8T0LGI4_PHAAN|nr:uncharacterized protein HKW66_Vig0005430 [Vigna angularis]
MSGKECRSGSLGGAVTTAEHFTQTSLLSVSTSRGRRRGGDREASEEQALEGNDDGRVFEQEPLELERGPDAEEKGGVSAKERGDVSHDDEGVEGGEEGGGGGEEEGELSEDKGEPHDKEGDGLKAEGTRMATTGVPPRSGGVSWRLTRHNGVHNLGCTNGGLCGGYLCEEDDALKVVVDARKCDMIHGGNGLGVWKREEDDVQRWWRRANWFRVEVAMVVVQQVLRVTAATRVRWWLWVVSTSANGGLVNMVARAKSVFPYIFFKKIISETVQVVMILLHVLIPSTLYYDFRYNPCIIFL